ncbi:uncharacterized protein LOC116663076 isoform X2 [Camelus ferus]|uniref:Uncharacterized protein LOC116663076 isoform X2 n=1 Tax=Camelus ferus TaxID=419612 RepID=A0A8B8SU93_CAMFR|nr:uncharacterized protein LOC116663076 isoform X2 [Camelus ferus]XP_032333511.1 uncharacterized protein LOC116663076 isoform X2 [Camelus ferus]
MCLSSVQHPPWSPGPSERRNNVSASLGATRPHPVCCRQRMDAGFPNPPASVAPPNLYTSQSVRLYPLPPQAITRLVRNRAPPTTASPSWTPGPAAGVRARGFSVWWVRAVRTLKDERLPEVGPSAKLLPSLSLWTRRPRAAGEERGPGTHVPVPSLVQGTPSHVAEPQTRLCAAAPAPPLVLSHSRQPPARTGAPGARRDPGQLTWPPGGRGRSPAWGDFIPKDAPGNHHSTG